MNNEPVAWIIDASMTDCDDNFIWNTGNYPDWQVKDWIPLYTHPVKEPMMVLDGNRVYPAFKELTDEEILLLTWFKDNPYDIFIEYEKEDLIDFARAVLRKAQEK